MGYRNGLLGSNGLKANVPFVEEPIIYSFILNRDSLHTEQLLKGILQEKVEDQDEKYAGKLIRKYPKTTGA